MLQSMGSQRVGHSWVTEQEQFALYNHTNVYLSSLLSMGITTFSFFQLSLQKLATWQWTFSYLSMGVDVQEFLEGRVFL